MNCLTEWKVHSPSRALFPMWHFIPQHLFSPAVHNISERNSQVATHTSIQENAIKRGYPIFIFPVKLHPSSAMPGMGDICLVR
ncbi:hypothetical protein CD178_02083 [Komagataeibacter saccharivorans]|uniref:Uncharacterized protein n=1 Tax=Komagataeibacter saccharivorans TaxID=265959 RepID=A0A347WD96_9PROT|nr:hypothetical protein CD178_02083 [Komagataeibacter saccharivorans]